MQEAINDSREIWDKCVNAPFVQGLKTGNLPIEKFKEYMIQDSIYLKHYARVYGQAIYQASTLRDIQMYYSVLSFVNDTESAVRINYLKQFGLSDDDIEFITPLPENQNYIDFMVDIASQGNSLEILMAVLPCMLSYSYIFKIIGSEDGVNHSPYYDFISDYMTSEMEEICQKWTDFADEKCQQLSDDEKGKLIKIFRKGSLLELDFWKMAYGGEKSE